MTLVRIVRRLSEVHEVCKHTLIGNPAQRERGRRLAGEFLANYTVDLPFKRQSNAMVFLKNRGNVWFFGVKNRGMVYFRSNF